MSNLNTPHLIDDRRMRELRRGINALRHWALILDADLKGRKLLTVKMPLHDEIPAQRCKVAGLWYGCGAQVATCPFCEEPFSRDERTDEVKQCEHYHDDDGTEWATFMGPPDEYIEAYNGKVIR